MDMSSFCVSLWKRKLELDTQGDSGQQKHDPALPKGSQTSFSFFPLSSRQSWTEQPVDAILLLNLKTWQGKIGCPQVQCPKPTRGVAAFDRTSSLHPHRLGYSTSFYPFPVFHCHLAVKNYDQPYRAGIRREPSGSHGFEIDLSFMSKAALISSSLCLPSLCWPFCLHSLFNIHSALAAPACSFEVSVDVCQTAQDFVTSPNIISTFCGHFIPSTTSDWFACRADFFLDQVNMNTKTKSIIMLAKHHQSTSRNFHTHTLELYSWSLAPITPRET